MVDTVLGAHTNYTPLPANPAVGGLPPPNNPLPINAPVVVANANNGAAPGPRYNRTEIITRGGEIIGAGSAIGAVVYGSIMIGSLIDDPIPRIALSAIIAIIGTVLSVMIGGAIGHGAGYAVARTVDAVENCIRPN